MENPWTDRLEGMKNSLRFGLFFSDYLPMPAFKKEFHFMQRQGLYLSEIADIHVVLSMRNRKEEKR